MISLALIVCTFLACTHGLRIVCYVSNQAQYRAGIGTYTPDNVDPFICTHLVYSYARLQGTELKPTEWNDDSNDKAEGMYAKFVNLKERNKELKLLLAIGDLTEPAESFVAAASDYKKQEETAKNIISYIRNRHFDGVTLEWSSLMSKPSPNYDKEKFMLLVKTIREAFQEEMLKSGNDMLILAVTLPSKKKEIDEDYWILDIVTYADFISIRAFDFITAEDRKVGLTSAYHERVGAQGDEQYHSFSWVARYYVHMGVPRDKINLGISTFGRSFLLKNPSQSRPGDAAVDYGNVGPWSALIGMLGRYEICQSIWTGGSVVNVPSQSGRYHVKGSEWVSYEDTLSVAQKACFIKEEKLSGITFWFLDLDDFSGRGCREGQYPLISTVLHVMRSTNPAICDKVNSTTYLRALSVNRTSTNILEPVTEKKRVVCYLQSWAYHRRGKGLFVPENIEPTICTHIVYAFATIRGNTLKSFFLSEESEPWREGLFQRLLNSKESNPELKVLVALGGGDGEKFLDLLPSDASILNEFAMNALKFVRQNGFDGLELTWERPTQALKQKFLDCLKALREAFNKEAPAGGKSTLLLTVTMPAGKAKIDVFGRDILEVEKAVDWMSVRTFDFHGSWEKFTGLNSPLYAANYEGLENKQLNMDWVGRYYFSLGVSKRNVNLGIPTYGRSYALQDHNNNGVYAQISGAGASGQFTGTPGLLAYYEVCDFLTHGAEVVNVPEQRVPYAFLDNQWVSFENVDSVTEKACYITQLRFGGVILWSLDLDDFMGLSCEQGKFPLVATVYNIVQHIDTSKCSNFQLMKAISGAGERGLPGQHLKYLNVILVLALVVYSACI